MMRGEGDYLTTWMRKKERKEEEEKERVRIKVERGERVVSREKERGAYGGKKTTTRGLGTAKGEVKRDQ